MDWRQRLTTTKGKELSKTIREMESGSHSTGDPTYWFADTNET